MYLGRPVKRSRPGGHGEGASGRDRYGNDAEAASCRGESDLTAGISNCASCDAAFSAAKMLRWWGTSAALEETLFIARFAKKVYVIHQRGAFRAVQSLQERIFELPNVEVLWHSTVKKIEGEKGNGASSAAEGWLSEVACGRVFVFTGRIPSTTFLDGAVALDERGILSPMTI